MSKLILETLHRKNKSQKIPVWLMRQAGRYLPEYKEIRSQKKGFLDLCYDSELASEITLQPIKRFNFDAAIIFSDILVIPDSMGIEVVFEENQGPLLKPINDILDFKKLETKINRSKLNPCYQAIKKTKESLPDDVALIGFSGAAWTLAAYIVEGKLSKDLSKIKSVYYNDKKFILYLIEELVENITDHLIKQIESGAEIVQIFDSWAGFLTEDDYEELIIKPSQKIVHNVKEKFPQIPIICFPRMSGMNYKKFCIQVECDAIGVDQYIPLDWIIENSSNKIIQGNLDPICLLNKSQEELKKKVDMILSRMKGREFIFNLGHGVVPQTPVENVKFLVDYIRSI